MLVSLIRGQMAVIRANAFIFLLILLCTLVVSRSENEERREELFLSQLVDSSGKVDEEMAELLWIHCGQDLVHLKEAVEHVNLCFPEETPRSTDNIDMKTQSMVRENIEKLINVLNPQLKQTLLDCIRKNDLFQVAGEEGGSKVWYTKYLDLLFSWPHARERKLAADGLQSAPAPAPNPAVGSPIYIPGPRHQPSRRPPTTKQDPFFPSSSDNSGSEPTSAGENSSKSANSGSDIKRNGGNNQHKTIIIACVVTAAVTFAVATLFFLCCTRAFRKGSGVGRNDEKPLLSLSLSDYSVGSSLNLGGSLSLKEEKLGHQSYINNSNHHKKASSLDSSFYLGSDVLCNSPDERPSSESAGNSTKTSSESLNTSNTTSAPVTPPLKPPPGRLSATVQGQPPLNPPPGRAVPLPPEPPASLRPPSRAGPTPPPPPAPPPLQKTSAGAPGPRPPAPPPPAPAGPRLPPPPKTTLAPRPPPLTSAGPKVPRPPSGPKHLSDNEGDVPRAKLKPFFWDKVLANPDHSMVWHQLKAGSFQFNEEMIESLFGYSTAEKNKNEGKESSSHGPSPQFIQILDPKKAQNLSILLKALNVTTEEVCDALIEGNELPTELIQTLLKMAPTTDEELKLRLYSGGISQLGPAERFLKALVNIPFAFKRLEALLFMCSLEEEVAMTKESFETLEVACKELRNSRLFLKLLEAVLKTGNRMNDGTFRGGAQAFKLDTLLKLSDVKGTDGKTTLLHFVVQEIIRSEGLRAARAARESRSFSSIKTDDLMVEETFDDHEEHYRSLGLQVVSRLSSELENVKKAAIIDADSLIGTVAKLGHSLLKTRDFLNTEMKSLEEESGFHQTLKGFVLSANEDVTWLLEEEKRIMALVKSTGDYFHGKAGKDEGLRLFAIVRDFLIMLDKVCREVRAAQKKPAKTQRKEASTAPSSADPRQSPIDPRSSRIDPRQRLFPAIAERRMNGSGSDSDSDSS